MSLFLAMCFILFSAAGLCVALLGVMMIADHAPPVVFWRKAILLTFGGMVAANAIGFAIVG
jgi:hypothetical protein